MENRKTLRNAIRKKRLSLSPQFQQEASKSLLLTLSSHSKIKAADHIAIYLSNDGELDTFPFIRWCWENNKHVYLPVLHPFCKGYLLFLKYTENTEMIKNQYGILEPKLNVNLIKLPHTLDIMFTPLVAFDDKGSRLGMGGGFYDRTLQHWFESFKTNKEALPYPIGLAHNCQQTPQIPREIWDIPLPEIITPSKQFIF